MTRLIKVFSISPKAACIAPATLVADFWSSEMTQILSFLSKENNLKADTKPIDHFQQ